MPSVLWEFQEQNTQGLGLPFRNSTGRAREVGARHYVARTSVRRLHAYFTGACKLTGNLDSGLRSVRVEISDEYTCSTKHLRRTHT